MASEPDDLDGRNGGRWAFDRPRARAESLRWSEQGAWHGAWTVALATFPAALFYYVEQRELPLPWGALAAQFATFVPITGALYGAGMAVGIGLSDSLPIRSSARRLLAPPLASLGGAIGGIGPGIFAALHFGAIDAPFFGVGALYGAGVVGVLPFGTVLFRVRGASLGRALAASSAPLAIAAVLGIATWSRAAKLLAGFDSTLLLIAWGSDLALFGAAFGAIVGVVLGGWLGCGWATLARHVRV